MNCFTKKKLPDNPSKLTPNSISRTYGLCSDDHTTIKEESGDILIDAEGNIDPTGLCYRDLKKFDNDSYVFAEDWKKGVKNSKGEILIPAKYDLIRSGFEGKYYVVGQKIEDSNYNLYGVYNDKGEAVSPVTNKSFRIYDFGLRLSDEFNKNIFYNNDLKNVYGEKFDRINVSNNGLILASNYKEKYFDIINNNPKYQLKSNITMAKSTKSGFSQISHKDGTNVLYNDAGEEIYKTENSMVIFKDAIKGVAEASFVGKKGLINYKGKWIVQPGNYSFEYSMYMDGIIVTDEETKKSHLINSNGDLLYEDVTFSSKECKGNFVLKQNYKHIVVSPEGKLLVPAGQYRIRQHYMKKDLYIFEYDHTYLVKLK